MFSGALILFYCHVIIRHAIQWMSSSIIGKFQQIKRGALIFSLICAWINGWVNNREAGNLRRKCAHYDVIVMNLINVLFDVAACWRIIRRKTKKNCQHHLGRDNCLNKWWPNIWLRTFVTRPSRVKWEYWHRCDCLVPIHVNRRLHINHVTHISRSLDASFS